MQDIRRRSLSLVMALLLVLSLFTLLPEGSFRDEGCHIMPRQHRDNGLRLSDGEQLQRCGYPDRQRDSEHRDLTAHGRGQAGHFGNASE